MDNALTAVADARGFLTRPEVLDCGYDDQLIREALRTGEWVRIGPGLYATRLSPHASRRTTSRGVDLSLVNVTRLDHGRGRHEAGVFHHLGAIDDADIEEVDGLLVAKAARSVWETACIASTEAGLVTADSALHLGIVTREQLDDIGAQFDHWQGSRSARLTLRLTDARAGSPGESRTRHLFMRLGLPRPELQFTVATSRGVLIGYTDFAWPEYRHVAEFDGKIKYDGSLGTTGKQALFDEKKREDAIRGQSLGMSRVVWSQLDPPIDARTAHRVRADMEQSRKLYTRNRTIIVSWESWD